MNKILKKISASVLTTIFTFSQNIVLAENPVELAESLPEQKLSVLGEVPEKRSEFTKHFRMSDGSMKAIVYSDQVHYKSGDEFKEIDNTLIDADNNTYKNTDSSFKVSLSKNFKNKNLINIESDDHSISMSYIKKKYKKFRSASSSEESKGNSSNDKKQNTSDQKVISEALCEEDLSKIPETEVDASNVGIENFDKTKMSFKNEDEEKICSGKTHSKAKYENSDTNIDLNYTLSGLGFNENIVLKNKSNDNDRFDFEVKTDLIATKDKNGNLNFKDSSEKVVFTMPKGCMWDSNDAYSSDVNYEISGISGGYIISIIPNRDWLDDNSRVYPIMIDPSITTSSVIDTSSFEYVYAVTDPSNPSNNCNNQGHVPVGTTDYNYVSFFKYTKLPKFSHGEIVTGSKFSMYLPASYSDMPVTFGSLPQYDCLYEVTEPWEDTVLTANNMPSVSQVVSDYVKVDTTDKWYDWDITKLVKTWYTLDNPNDNCGFSFNSINPANYGLVRYVSKTGEHSSTKSPKLEINYREFVGEENYWSYKSHGSGYKGIGKVNGYAGTLSVSENVLSYSGSLNPVSISNTYNNVNYNEQANAYFHTKSIPGGYSKSSFSGCGFRLSFDKIIYKLPEDDPVYTNPNLNCRYVYIDGDGTQHYFKLDNNVLVDEDGLGLTLIEATENNQPIIEIKDLKENKLTFNDFDITNKIYVLKSQEDNNGNTTTYNYEDGKITSITDAANRTTTISYIDNTNKVSKITAADGKEINFLYDDERLKEISYPENMKTNYEYDQQGRLCLVSTNEGLGRSIKYEYASNDKNSINFFKIRNFTEYGSQNANENTKGSSTEFWYEMNQTKITSKINNLDVPYRENTEIWQFDNNGQMTAVLDENDNMISNIYETESSRKKHKLKHTNDAGKYTNNLLKNTSADAEISSNNWVKDDWLKGSEDTSSSFSICQRDDSAIGKKCFMITNTQNDTWPIARQRVSIESKPFDRKFTFSGEINIGSEDPQEVGSLQPLSAGQGACLHISSFGPNNQQMSGDSYSRWFTDTHGKWIREFTSITVPAGATEVECAFGVKESTGSAYFDCLQLEESSDASDYNMIENSSFDNDLENWTCNTDSSGKVEGGKLKIIGDTETTKKVTQTISINKSNPTFAVRATAKGLAIPDKTKSRYSIECIINFPSGQGEPITIDIPFNPNVSDTQSIYGIISPADYGASSTSTKTVDSLEISPCFENNCNTVYFDNIQVCIDDEGTSYERNNNGSPTKIRNSLGEEQLFNRDVHSDEVLSHTDERGNVTSFAYDTASNHKHRCISSTSSAPNTSLENSYDYSTKGNITRVTTKKSQNPDKEVVSVTEYGGAENGNNQNYPTKTIDQRNKETTYAYNSDNGNLNSVTNANNVQSSYTYDNEGKITSETCSGIQNTYSYVNGILNSITHKVSESLNTTYKFIRDIFGNITETKIGNRTLSKSTYDAGGGLLRQVKYGNEQTVNYDYDDKGRLVKKSFGYEKGNKFGEITYTYDSKDRLVESYDSLNDVKSKIFYDKFGRFSRVEKSNGVSSEVHYATGSLIEKSISSLFGINQSVENTFGASDFLTNSKISMNNSEIDSHYDYDGLARLQNSDVLASNSSSGIRHEFEYLGVENDQTRATNFISSVEIKKKVSGDWTSTGEKFNYTYDNLGNITAVTNANNSPIASYEYDALNQLVRENNSQTGKTVTYTYNAGGNLTEKKIYSYTTDSDLTNATLENTITYTYGDSNWADKLTSYNGQDIVYDAIGNPLEYRGWEFEWSRGRRLDKASKIGDNINVSYKYDENGIRTQKVINGVQTDFITSGIKVLAQKSGNDTIVWQIDGSGNTVGFNYNGTPYFYMKNLQGDIIGITDTSGNTVAKYAYDSWGKLISIKDSDDVDRTDDITFIGYINPLRYRGYYYDTETGLYYLNARYYDPEVGRFISADETLDGGYNLFEYCENNPVKYHDKTGENPGDLFNTMDEAAADFGLYINAQSIAVDREFGTYLYKIDTLSGTKYSYTQPHTSNGRDAVGFEVLISRRTNKCFINLGTNSVNVVAIPHTHGAYSFWYSNDSFSREDRDAADGWNIPSYLVNPLGELRRYDPHSPQKNGVLIRSDMPSDPNHLKTKLKNLFS